MLKIHCMENYREERNYIYDVIFKYFWKMDYVIQYERRKDVLLEMGNCKLRLSDAFFQQNTCSWLKQSSLPPQPLKVLQVSKSYAECVTDINLPMIYGDTFSNEVFDEPENYCYLDILGSSFFMLTRYEEIVKHKGDKFGRFPAKESLAFQEKFLERPIINEYLELLWRWMKYHWPRLERPKRSFVIMPTHDVDFPFWSLCVVGHQKYRIMLGDIIKRHDMSLMLTHWKILQKASDGNFDSDPYNTFDAIMKISEREGLTSKFFFMTAQGRNSLDGNYDVLNVYIKRLARNILERGHEIGIHPGLASYCSADYIQSDADKLREMIKKENLDVVSFGGRQHYLQWKAPETWGYYENAGICYDSTLTYADHIGFRCGICYEYPTYNAVTHRRYNLREYPLEVMEATGLDNKYMNLSVNMMFDRTMNIRKHIEKYNGIFVILWHNSRLTKSNELDLYKSILQ